MNLYTIGYKFLSSKTKLVSFYDNVIASIKYSFAKRRSIKNIRLYQGSKIPDSGNEIRLFAIMRNESLRLPYFIKYYKNLGVDRFFIIDNNSSDGSFDIIKSQDNMHIFQTTENYIKHWCWMEYLLDTFGKNHWCVVVDIDELISYPRFPKITLKELCPYLEKKGETGVRSILLDMYGNKPVSQINYVQGENPIEHTPFFDKQHTVRSFEFFDKRNNSYFRTSTFTGGMRDRIFGDTNPPTILSKISLFKNGSKTYLFQGMHAISGANISKLQGVVFHTKFLSDFLGEVKEECKREQHYGGAFYYKIFNRKLLEAPDINFYYNDSEKFRDAQQLVDFDLMKTTPEFEAYVAEIITKKETI